MQQMASDIFVRILRGMGACRKKPAQPASGSQLDDSIGNTPTTVSWRVWGYEVGLGWRLASSGISLPNNVFSWLLSDFTGPFSRPKNPSKTCAPQGASPVAFEVRGPVSISDCLTICRQRCSKSNLVSLSSTLLTLAKIRLTTNSKSLQFS